MKKIPILLFFFFVITGAFAQKSFEGEIVYAISIKSNDPNISSEQLNGYAGTEMHHYLKGANYKSTFNGRLSQWQLYKDKQVYDKFSTRDSLFSHDSAINHDTIYKTILKRNDTTILGYPCDKLTFICNTGTQVYYFNSQFAIDAELYIDNKEGNWYEFLKISKSSALKEIMQRGKIVYTLTATSIQQKAIPDNLFTLPAGMGIIDITSKLNSH